MWTWRRTKRVAEHGPANAATTRVVAAKGGSTVSGRPVAEARRPACSGVAHDERRMAVDEHSGRVRRYALDRCEARRRQGSERRQGAVVAAMAFDRVRVRGAGIGRTGPGGIGERLVIDVIAVMGVRVSVLIDRRGCHGWHRDAI